METKDLFIYKDILKRYLWVLIKIEELETEDPAAFYELKELRLVLLDRIKDIEADIKKANENI